MLEEDGHHFPTSTQKKMTINNDKLIEMLQLKLIKQKNLLKNKQT